MNRAQLSYKTSFFGNHVVVRLGSRKLIIKKSRVPNRYGVYRPGEKAPIYLKREQHDAVIAAEQYLLTVTRLERTYHGEVTA